MLEYFVIFKHICKNLFKNILLKNRSKMYLHDNFIDSKKCDIIY